MLFGRRKVHYREYPQAIDLTGKDLISLFSRHKKDVAVHFGGLALKEDMERRRVSRKVTFSMTSEVPDEVHEWPNATQGASLRHLVLQFRDDCLMGMQWRSMNPPA